MSWNTTERLGSVLTREQLIRVEWILSCDAGKNRRLDALREYFRRPEVSNGIKESGWDPYTLAYTAITNHDRQRDTQES